MMVDVESYMTGGSKDFNKFSCGGCGSYYDTEEEAELCCQLPEEKKEKKISYVEDGDSYFDEKRRLEAEEKEIDRLEGEKSDRMKENYNG